MFKTGDKISYGKEYTGKDEFLLNIIEDNLIFEQNYIVRESEINFGGIFGNNWYRLNNPGDYGNYWYPEGIFDMNQKECLRFKYNLR